MASTSLRQTQLQAPAVIPRRTQSNQKTGKYPVRTSSSTTKESSVAGNPELMASLVDSLTRITPSPYHSFLFDDTDDVSPPPTLKGRSLISPPEINRTTPPVKDYRTLRADDAPAQAPVVKTSKLPDNYSAQAIIEMNDKKRMTYTTEIPTHIKQYLRSESDDRIARVKLSREKIREQYSKLETPPISPVEPSKSFQRGVYRRHSVQLQPDASHTTSPPKLSSSTSSPTSPHSKSKSQSNLQMNPNFKRQSSFPHSQPQSPQTNHRRSASGHLRRLSSPSFVNPTSPPANDDRSSQADSIKDSVEAYLSSPRLSQKVQIPSTGRVVSFSEVGDSNGHAVFICVGMGLTRYITAFYDELALSLGLRLITPDRPGVGESEAIPESERTVLSWPGAIYALATALRVPGQIRGKIHLLAPWIPPSQMNLIGHPQGEASPAVVPTVQRILRALPTPVLRAANSSFMSATSSSLTSSLPKTSTRKKRPTTDNKRPSFDRGKSPSKTLNDRPTVTTTSANNEDPSIDGIQLTSDLDPVNISSALDRNRRESSDPILSSEETAAAEKERQQTYDEYLTHAIWASATRGANPAVDLLICLERTRPIGFRYVDITRAVIITHGAKDNRVPVENVKWLGTTMRRCEVRVLPDEGHGLMASASVMGDVLSEIAAEWREWKRAMNDRGISGQPFAS